MKKTVYKNLLRVFTAIVVLSAGVLIGSYLTEAKIAKEQGGLYNTTKIAVVNLDEGATYEGIHRNFASELMSSQDKDIVVTGLDDAKSGVGDGRYSAYIVMPSNFSRNTTTINTEPVKSLISYEIGSNLSDVARDKATVNVLDINKSINDDLGYVYLNSVFNSFHEGQNSALKVIGNDSKDKEVIMAISNVNLIESVNLTEVERLENDVETLNIVEDFEKNQALIDSIDMTYKSYLGKTTEEISAIKADSENIKSLYETMNKDVHSIPTIESVGYQLNHTNGVLSRYSNKLSNFKTDTTNLLNVENSNSQNTVEGYITYVNDFIDQVNVFNTNLSQYNKYLDIKDDFVDTTSAIEAVDFQSVADRIDLIIKENEKTNIKKQIELYITNTLLDQFGTATTSDEALEALYLGAETDQSIVDLVARYADTFEEPTIDSLQGYYEHTRNPDTTETPLYDETTLKNDVTDDIKTNLPVIYQTVIDDLESNATNFPVTAVNTSAITDITTNQDNKTFDLTSVLDKISNFTPISNTDVAISVADDLEPLKNQEITAKIALINSSINNGTLGSQFTTRLQIFDPLSFIDEREVEGFAKDYKRNNIAVESKISTKDFEYKSFVDKSYTHANKHVDIIGQDINKYQQLSDEKVTSGLQNAQDAKSKTSSENQKVMRNFVNTLPYSRLGENANSTLYQFMVEPVNSEGKESSLATSNNRDNYDTYFLIALIGSSVLLIGTMGYKKITREKSQS